jgi:hypothetical protein
MGGKIGPPAPHILETELGDEIGLYDPHQERVTVLNVTASDVWRLATGEFDQEQVVGLLARAYRVKPDAIRADVIGTLERFAGEGLLTEGGG